jgi:signal transduction histidine kinase/predicted hydrocarbon binding protein
MFSYETLLCQERPGTLRFGGARMALLDIEAGFWGLRRQLEALAGSRLADAVLQQAGANGGASFAATFTASAGGSPAMACSSVEAAHAFRDCLAAYQAAGFGHFEVDTMEWPGGPICVRGTDTFEAWMMQQHDQTPEAPACAYTAGVLVGFVNVLGCRQDIVCIEQQCQAQGAAHCRFELLPASQSSGGRVVAYDPDPFLSRQLNLLNLLFEQTPTGIAIFDPDLRLRRFNPTWAQFVDLYTAAAASHVLPGVSLFELAPGSESSLQPILQRALAGETVRVEALRIETGGIVSYWDAVFIPLYEDGKVAGVLDVTTDATQRVLSAQALQTTYQTLEQRVEERTRELSTLLEVSRSLISTLELQPLLELILEKLKGIIDYDGASIMVQEGPALQVLAYRGPLATETARQLRFSLADAGPNQDVMRSAAPVIMNDVWNDTGPPATAFRHKATAYKASGIPFTYVRSWLGVPLLTKDRCLGMLSLDHGSPGYYTPHHKQLALAFASQVATAIENARFHAYAEEMAVASERNRLARELHDAVTQTLFSASLIAEVLPRIWQKDPAAGEARLVELRELTRGALAEMRTLLLELRPATLTESSLAELLKQLTTAVIGRSRLAVDLEVKDERPLPPDVQVTLYRITQESLNNITKHAAASQVTINLTYKPDKVSLTIRDDGRGFDPATVAVPSLGLTIMRERAGKIGAALTINSEIGQGTVVTVAYPIKPADDS